MRIINSINKISNTYLQTLFLSGGSQLQVIKQILQQYPSKPMVAYVDDHLPELINSMQIQSMAAELGYNSYDMKTAIGTDVDLTAEYEQFVADVITAAPCHAFVGIGEDGHTAGILPHLAQESTKFYEGYVTSYNQRVTLTFNALNKMSALYVYAVGESKSEILKQWMNYPEEQINRDVIAQFPALGLRKHSNLTLITDLDLV